MSLCGQESRHCPKHLRVGQQQCGAWPGIVSLAGICTGAKAKPPRKNGIQSLKMNDSLRWFSNYFSSRTLFAVRNLYGTPVCAMGLNSLNLL